MPEYKTIVIDLTTPTALVVKPAVTKIQIAEKGMQGIAGEAVQNLFIQDTQPSNDGPYMWVDTSDNNLSFWIEDGT